MQEQAALQAVGSELAMLHAAAQRGLATISSTLRQLPPPDWVTGQVGMQCVAGGYWGQG